MAARQLDPTRTLTVVSGLPRSGTSLMMQMLEAAGLAIASDGVRGPDADNPRGYFELDAVKRMREETSFLEDIVGRVVKIVAPLLPLVPEQYDLRVVFIERGLAEIMASQRVMLDRLDREAGDDAPLVRAYESGLREVKAWLGSRMRTDTCYVAHDEVLLRPEVVSARVLDFLDETSGEGASLRSPGDRAIALSRMTAIVEPGLHRSRTFR
jgi:hypothetical protein